MQEDDEDFEMSSPSGSKGGQKRFEVIKVKLAKVNI